YYFFFQAEDGIRDFHVTGVQTCALPICAGVQLGQLQEQQRVLGGTRQVVEQRLGALVAGLAGWQAQLDQTLLGKQRQAGAGFIQDRKSTRLNSSHVKISYAVFCLKKKKD